MENIKLVERKHVCPQCDFECTRKDSLKRHMHTVHSDRGFNCHQCEFLTNRKDSLNRHIKRVHAVSASQPISTPHAVFQKDQEMDLMEESMEVWKIYKLLQRMKK